MNNKKYEKYLWLSIPLFIVLFNIIIFLAFYTEFLSALRPYLTFIFDIYLVTTVIVIFMEKKNSPKMISWLLVIYVLPGLGLILYLVLGRSFRKKRRVKNKRVYSEKKELKEGKKGAGLVELLINNSGSELLYHNNVKVMADGTITFAIMLEELKKAKSVINFEFFIIKDDLLGNKFKNILIEKAKEGVEVNVLYDAVGSWRLSKEYKDDLEKAGVNIRVFLPVLTPFVSRNLNYRNHRKIVTIDGLVGFVGGLNIGDEYVGKKEKFGYWRDTHLMLEGDSVYELTTIFLDDWEFSGGKLSSMDKYYPPHQITNETWMQIVPSGPDSSKRTIMQGYFKLITGAKKNICITTPYLVPEEALLEAIKIASLSGVDVKIIIPFVADHFMVYWANQSYIEELLESGVKIYFYKGGFVHAKVLLVDDRYASVGTANLDIRSMELNFEVNTFIYNEAVVTELKNDFEEDIRRSELVYLETFKKRKIYRKVLERFGRLVSPLQ